MSRPMTPRERLRRALAHEEPDRVPIDVGNPATSIHRAAYGRLREHLGMAPEEPKVIDRMQQVVEVGEAVLRSLGADTRQLFLKPARGWHENTDGTFTDEWGIGYRSAAGGAYFDMVSHPLAEATREDLDRFPWPDPESPVRTARLAEEAAEIRDRGDYAIVLNGFSETIFGLASWLRGAARFYMDLLLEPVFVGGLLDQLLDYALRLARRALEAVGPHVDVIRVADDLGTESTLLVSPELYRAFIKPRQRAFYAFLKEHSDARILLHSCGAISELIPDLIEIGVDAINPVQVSAAGMDSRRLKRDFGDRLSFWGGGCDTQRVLPFGTVEQVKAEVRRRVGDFAPGGGFVFTPVHNIQFDIPPEKVVAMYRTAVECGRYS